MNRNPSPSAPVPPVLDLFAGLALLAVAIVLVLPLIAVGGVAYGIVSSQDTEEDIKAQKQECREAGGVVLPEPATAARWRCVLDCALKGEARP